MPGSTIATFSPRDGVCAVPYSQLSPEPVPGASSLHCCSGGCELSIAQKDVTGVLAVSLRPLRSPAAAALLSWEYVHAWVPGTFVLQAASAPGRPSIMLKLKRPSVGGRAPVRTDPPDGRAVVVVVGGPAHVPSAAQASKVL